MANALKKAPAALFSIILAAGASLTLGLLSFGGMYALWPIWPLAIASFMLSGAYEWEIYFQNIKGALNKLFIQKDYLKNSLTKTYLLTNCPTDDADDQPAIFSEYKALLRQLNALRRLPANRTNKQQKRAIELQLQALELTFSQQMFNPTLNDASKGLHMWLDAHQPNERNTLLNTFLKQQFWYRIAAIFSLGLSNIFMGLGTIYLLSETSAIIPFLATSALLTSPTLLLPLAIIAGTAYGLLTYNTITDMINHDTLKKIVQSLNKPWREIFTRQQFFKTLGTVFLITLAATLTICTAGTWWTVAKQANPLLNRLIKLPSFIMRIINPIILGLSALFFNWQNTIESLEIIQEPAHEINPEHAQEHHHARVGTLIRELWHALRNKENLLQLLNPARLILMLTIKPLRCLLFLGHLISIGVTGDRVPGIPQIISTLLGIISEGFEDWHYFFGHEHPHHSEAANEPDISELLNERLTEDSHGHNHDLDLPTICLKIAFSPVYLLASIWDWGTSQLNRYDTRRPVHTLTTAVQIQCELHIEDESHDLEEETHREESTPLFGHSHHGTTRKSNSVALQIASKPVKFPIDPSYLRGHRFYGSGEAVNTAQDERIVYNPNTSMGVVYE